MTERDELEVQKNQVWAERFKLDRQIEAINKQIREEIVAAGANYVGRTLRREVQDGVYEYAMLIAAPFESWHGKISSPDFNEYRIPAFRFLDDGSALPIFDFIFTGNLPDIEGVRKGNSLLDSVEWEWCSKQEFDDELKELFAWFNMKFNNPLEQRDFFNKIYDGM